MDTPQLPPLPRRQPLNDVTQYINPDIHGERMSWAGARGGIRNERPDTYKTVICQSWLESGGCAFGENCRFAHGEHELRPMSMRNIRNASKYKTKLCEKYTKTGICPYGSRCLFIHPAPRAGTTYFNTPVAPPQPLMKIPLNHLTSTPLNNVSNCTCFHAQPLTGMDGTPVRHDGSLHHRHPSGFPSWMSDPSALNGFATVEDFSPPNPTPLMTPLSVDVGKQRSMSDSVVGVNWTGSLTETLPEAFDAPTKEDSGTGGAVFNPFTSVSPFSALNPFTTKPSPGGTSVSTATSPYSSIFSLSSGIWSPDNEPAQKDLEPVVYPIDQYGVPFGSSGAFGSIGSRSLGQDDNTPTLGDLTSVKLPAANPWADETTTIQQGNNERVVSSAGPVEMLGSLNL